MKDCKGRELQIGDEVAYVHGKNSDARLQTGKVTRIYAGRYGREECSVDGNAHIFSFRVMKMDDYER